MWGSQSLLPTSKQQHPKISSMNRSTEVRWLGQGPTASHGGQRGCKRLGVKESYWEHQAPKSLAQQPSHQHCCPLLSRIPKSPAHPILLHGPLTFSVEHRNEYMDTVGFEHLHGNNRQKKTDRNQLFPQ